MLVPVPAVADGPVRAAHAQGASRAWGCPVLLGKLGPAAEAVLVAALLAGAGSAGAAGSTPAAAAYWRAMAAWVRQMLCRLHLHQQLRLAGARLHHATQMIGFKVPVHREAAQS